MFSALSSLSSDLQSLESALEESREKESEARKRSAEARARGAEEFHEAHDKWDEKAKRRRELFQQLNTFVEEDDEHSAMLEARIIPSEVLVNSSPQFLPEKNIIASLIKGVPPAQYWGGQWRWGSRASGEGIHGLERLGWRVVVVPGGWGGRKPVRRPLSTGDIITF